MDKIYRTRITILVCVGIFIFAISVVTSERLIPNFEDVFNILHAKAGAIISSYMLGFLFAILTGSILSDFLSKKLLILSGFFLLTIGCILLGTASSYPFLLLGHLFMGIAGGLLEGLLSIVIMGLFNDRKGMALNLSQAFFGIGAGIAPFFAVAFPSWRIPYFIIAFISTIIATLFIFQHFPERIDKGKEKERVSKEFFSRDFVLIVLGMILYISSETGIVSWISTLFIKELNSRELWGTLVLSSFWIGQLIGRSTIGLNVDRFKSEQFMSLFFFLSSLFTLSALMTKRVIPSFILFSISGFTMAPLWPTILSDAHNKFTKYPGTAFGIIVAGGSFAGILIAPVIGRIADKTSLSVGMLLIPITAISGSIVYFYLHLINHQSYREKRNE